MRNMSFICSISSSTIGGVSFSYFSHRNECERVFHWFQFIFLCWLMILRTFHTLWLSHMLSVVKCPVLPILLPGLTSKPLTPNKLFLKVWTFFRWQFLENVLHVSSVLPNTRGDPSRTIPALSVSSTPPFHRLLAIQPPWPPCCSRDPADIILPQDLCICLLLDLEYSSPNTHSLSLLQIFAQILLSWSNDAICLRDKGKAYHSQSGSPDLPTLSSCSPCPSPTGFQSVPWTRCNTAKHPCIVISCLEDLPLCLASHSDCPGLSSNVTLWLCSRGPFHVPLWSPSQPDATTISHVTLSKSLPLSESEFPHLKNGLLPIVQVLCEPGSSLWLGSCQMPSPGPGMD